MTKTGGSTVKAIAVTGVGKLVVYDCPEPVIGDYDALVKLRLRFL